MVFVMHTVEAHLYSHFDFKHILLEYFTNIWASTKNTLPEIQIARIIEGWTPVWQSTEGSIAHSALSIQQNYGCNILQCIDFHVYLCDDVTYVAEVNIEILRQSDFAVWDEQIILIIKDEDGCTVYCQHQQSSFIIILCT